MNRWMDEEEANELKHKVATDYTTDDWREIARVYSNSS